MNPLQLWRLVWLRTSRRLRDGFDRVLRPQHLTRRGERWAAAWRADRDGGDVAAWLAREDGGHFWLRLPYASAWARETCTPADIALATATAGGVFDLIGSGPVSLGEPPAWRTDLYTGREWPLERSDRLEIVRDDGSDIRTVWELSRGYHFPALARAYWTTDDATFRAAFARHVDSWIEQNPVGSGPHWASPMDAAIRAANWTLGLLLFAEAPGIEPGLWQRMLANLVSTGRFLERNLEWHPVHRGNHYVANGVGLVYLGVLFRGSRDGDRWLRRGARILSDEIRYQVHADGAAFEASLAYHRLDTELFAYGGELLRLNLPGGLPAAYEQRLRGMYRVIDAYLPPGGEAPMIGDADDGRLHALSAEGFAHPRRHRLGLPEPYGPAAPAAPAGFPDGGFYVLRGGLAHAVIRCGAVGLNGAGSHDHNDQLGLELVLGGRRVLADSGTYAYTRDLDARFAFRSTAAHSVVQLGGEEQNPIRADRPWRVLADRTRSRCTVWQIESDEQRFEGRHSGYEHRASGAVCVRRITLRPGDGRCEILDRVEGAGREAVGWRLHFAAGELRELAGSGGSHDLLFVGEPPVRVRVRLPQGLRLELGESSASDRYGVRYKRPCIVASGEVSLPVSIVAVLGVAGG